jgi:glycosyltransferase involved in cell wall biosynthesis
MKIALISTTMSVGGAEKQVADLANVLKCDGHEVTIISFKGPTRQQIPAGVHLIELHARKSLFGLCGLLFQLVRVLRMIRPDVAHSHMVVANIVTRIVKPFCCRPVVVVSSAHNTYEGGGRFRILAYRATDSLADLTTNVSKEAVQRYVSLGAAKSSRIRAVYNGIDFDRFRFASNARIKLRAELGLADSTRAYLAVGRLVEAKDYPNLLRAFAMVVQTVSNSALLIVGDGPEGPAIAELAASIGIASNVRMLGERLDVPALMSAADVFVLSSAWEGFPLVVTEAIACHLPVVATDSGGVAENLDGFGQIVPVADSVALASAMLDARAEQNRESDVRAIEARRHAQSKFAVQSVAREWVGIYGSLIEARTK